MPLKLMYITNNPQIAEIAQNAGVDRIWIDLEHIGKEDRQAGMNTVKSHHTIEDIGKIKPILSSSQLLVRVNPIHEVSKGCIGSKDEIDQAISEGADIIMLPMFKKRQEVEVFVDYVGGRAKVLLLLETAEANENIKDIITVPGIDEIHIGLNDLHLSYGKKFMFELLMDGTVDNLCSIFQAHGIDYGFGGIARIGLGKLPSEYVIAEHYRLGSKMAILSRSFCDANTIEDYSRLMTIFREGVIGIREREREVKHFQTKEFSENRDAVFHIIKEII